MPHPLQEALIRFYRLSKMPEEAQGLQIAIPRNLFNKLPPLPRYLTADASISLSLLIMWQLKKRMLGPKAMMAVSKAYEEANLERLEDWDDCVEFSEANSIKDLKDTASVPQPPSDCVPPAVKTENGEPKWEELDNPGDWSRYCFNPSFNKSGSYISHSLPTGAVPIPLDNGVRQCTGWTFLYKDWKMKDHWKSDGLFAPIVGAWAVKEAHRFKEVIISELVHFDGILIRDGLLGGSTDGAIYRRWQNKSPAFDPDTSSSLTHTRFLQLKRTLKLNDNKTAKKKGEEGYKPAYKYGFIFDVVCHNVLVITETASLDLCGDESSWAHQGWGESGAGIIARIQKEGKRFFLLMHTVFVLTLTSTGTSSFER
ncbi:hypothetical protein IV203_012112 [Nitzschia inconspicua]|uniref:Uncharacterized protein n=1 Tax=Nitzschia inconspicua TaxID=303405 RepID=A0A9K3KUN1_9STRA|nr:hypothetical protein IV203_012112 [Nitzschia inconspicua]